LGVLNQAATEVACAFPAQGLMSRSAEPRLPVDLPEAVPVAPAASWPVHLLVEARQQTAAGASSGIRR